MQRVHLELFQGFQLWQVYAKGDGNCMFHAYLMGVSKSYIKNVNERDMKAIGLRKVLADYLSTKVVNHKLSLETEHGENDKLEDIIKLIDEVEDKLKAPAGPESMHTCSKKVMMIVQCIQAIPGCKTLYIPLECHDILTVQGCIDLMNVTKRRVIEKIFNGKTIVYDYIFGGNLKDLGRHDYSYSLEGMKNTLNSSRYVGTEMCELVGSYGNKNIFVIDLDDNDVIIFGPLDEWYIKKRSSVVLFYSSSKRCVGSYDLGGHYDLCGVKHDNGTIVNHFLHEHAFIKKLIDRYMERGNYRLTSL
jgi:hypothetical protein